MSPRKPGKQVEPPKAPVKARRQRNECVALGFWGRKAKKKLVKAVEEDGSESPAEYVPAEWLARALNAERLRKDMAKIEEMLRAAQDEEEGGKKSKGKKSKAAVRLRPPKRQVGDLILLYVHNDVKLDLKRLSYGFK